MIKRLPALAALLPALVLLGFIWTTGSALPYEDLWDTPGNAIRDLATGQFQWLEIFHQHSEARKALTTLVWMGLSRGGWDARVDMSAAVLLYVLALGLYAAMLAKSRLLEGRRDAYLLVTAGLLTFTPFAMFMWLWGVNVENAVLVFLLVCGAAAAMRLGNSAASWASAAIFSILATFTFANGFSFWIVLCPLWFSWTRGRAGQRNQTGRRRWLLPLAAYAGTLAAVAFFYAHGYVQPPQYPTLSYVVAHPLRAFLFFVNIFGAPFSLKNGLSDVSALVFGLLSLLLGTGLAIKAVLASRNSQGSAPVHPWLILCGYSLVSVAMITVGRVGMDFHVSGSERYYNHTIPYHLGVLALLLTVRGIDSPKNACTRLLTTTAMAFYLAVVPVLIVAQWPAAVSHANWLEKERTLGETAVSFSPLFPMNGSYLWLYSSTPIPRTGRALEMARLGLLNIPLFPANSSAYRVVPGRVKWSLVPVNYVIGCRVLLRVDIPEGDVPPRNGYLVLGEAESPFDADQSRSVFPLSGGLYRTGAADGMIRYEFPLHGKSALVEGKGTFNGFILTF